MKNFIEKVYKKNSLPSLRGGIKGEVIAFEKEKLSDITSPLTPLLKKGEGKKRAFTLQETLIALTILGVVAAITLPYLIQKDIEATSRVKVKKAMAAYEKAVNQMVLENNIAGSIKAWAGSGCSETSKYFKIISGGNCRFQTSDKVWWDITDIEHPVIAFNEEDLDTEGAEGRFVLLTKNEDSILRINDPNTNSLTTDEQKALEDLYAFVNGEKRSADAGGGDVTQQSDFMKTCTQVNDTTYTCGTDTYTTFAFDDTLTDTSSLGGPSSSEVSQTNGLVSVVDDGSTGGKTWDEAVAMCEEIKAKEAK